MATRINHNINTLANGVTQQSQELRFDTQVSEMINYIPDDLGYIRKRQGLDSLNVDVFSCFNNDSNIHIFDNGNIKKLFIFDKLYGLSIYDTENGDKSDIVGIDKDEILNSLGMYYDVVYLSYGGENDTVKYFINTSGEQVTLVPSRTVVVLNYNIYTLGDKPEYAFLWGAEETVINSGSQISFTINEPRLIPYVDNYIDLKNPNKDIKMLTVGDTTWIINKNKVVEYETIEDSVMTSKAFYWIKKTTEVAYGTNYSDSTGYDYQINIDSNVYTANGLDNDIKINGVSTIGGIHTQDSIEVINGFARAINSKSLETGIIAENIESILYVSKKNLISPNHTFQAGEVYQSITYSSGWNYSYVTLASVTTYNSIFTGNGIFSYIKLTNPDDNTDIQYFDVNDNSVACDLCYKLSTGWLIDTGSVSVNIFDIKFYGSEYSLIPIKYYKSNYTDSEVHNRLFYMPSVTTDLFTVPSSLPTYKYVKFNDSSTLYDITTQQSTILGKLKIGQKILARVDSILLYYSINELVDYYTIGSTIEILYHDSSSSTFYESRKFYIDKTFEFSSGDSFGNQASFSWRDSVQSMKELPADMRGFRPNQIGTIAITGKDTDNFTNYYVKWNGDNWEETYKPNTRIKINPNFLVKLCRQSNGTFYIGYMKDYSNIPYTYNNIEYYPELFDEEFADRVIGDEDGNPMPSFLGSTISNIFFYANRLGFTSGESVCLSRTGDYYNFFGKTMLEIMDDDPIDVSVDSDKVNQIKHIKMTGGGMMLFSDNAQFMFATVEATLTPLNARISQISSYSSDNSLEPISVDNFVFFFDVVDGYVRTYRIALSNLNDTTTAEDDSLHIKKYVPVSDTQSIEASGEHNMLFISNGNYIYCYKYSFQNNNQKMGSWFKLQLPIYVLGMKYVDGKLYILSDDIYYPISYLNIGEEYTHRDFNVPNKYVVSRVELSKFTPQTQQGSRIFSEDLFLKNILVKNSGEDNILSITDSTRGSTYTYSLSDRKILLNSTSENMTINISNVNYNSIIGSINIEGIIKNDSRNVN